MRKYYRFVSQQDEAISGGGPLTAPQGRGGGCMTSEYFFFYTEANLVCCALFAVILMHDLRRFNHRETQVRFDDALAAHMLYFISDSCWAALVSGAVHFHHFFALLVNFSNFFLMGLLGYTWFRFMAASEQLPFRNTKKGKVLISLPMAVMSGVLALSYFAAPKLWVSDSGSLTPLYYTLIPVAPILYSAATLGFSVVRMRKQANLAQRNQSLLIGVYPIILIVAGLLQLLTLTAPVFCFGCAIMMLYFYIQTLEDQISIDPLTRLNNRGELMRYVSQDSNLRRTGLRTYVVMIDVNDFKFINDTYGHAEGDRALAIIADSLKGAVGIQRLNAFLGRFGGDEFILIVHAQGEEDLKGLCMNIRSRISQLCSLTGFPIRLSVGIGYDELGQAPDNFDACMGRADEKLYVDKRLQKQLRAAL